MKTVKTTIYEPIDVGDGNSRKTPIALCGGADAGSAPRGLKRASRAVADTACMRRSRRRVLASAAVLVAVLAGSAGAQPGAVAGRVATPAAARPNIVFVLTDDLSWNLVRYLPQVRALQSRGMTFDDYVVTDSLCCPSRASILTGRFPHDTGVFTNTGRDGGFAAFQGRGEEADTFATALQAQGYRTALMGKYLNGYQPADTLGGSRKYVPPGWNEWDVAGNGYAEFRYNLNENHGLRHYGRAPEDYLTDVLAGRGAAFIRHSARARKPFLLEVATFAPHAPYTPAPRDANALPGVTAPRGPAYDTLPADAPPWLAGRGPLSASSKKVIDHDFRARARSVLAVDDLIAGLRRTLADAGVADDTYVVFGSDNGYHMGEYRLTPGKMTAFDTDIRVPLVVTGPGVPAGRRSAAAVSNIDLAPTFAQAGGAPIPSTMDGRSLLSLLHGGSAAGWRTANLVEHHGPNYRADDPDRQAPAGGNPPSYEAMRTNAYTYVEYVDGSREYYDLTSDPLQLHNLAGTIDHARLDRLHTALDRLRHCRGGPDCWTAGHLRASP